MPDLRHVLAVLNERVHDADLVRKEWGEVTARNIAVLVDRRGQHGPAMCSKPGWVVCTPTKERNAEWRTANYHCSPSRRCSKMSRSRRSQTRCAMTRRASGM